MSLSVTLMTQLDYRCGVAPVQSPTQTCLTGIVVELLELSLNTSTHEQLNSSSLLNGSLVVLAARMPRLPSLFTPFPLFRPLCILSIAFSAHYPTQPNSTLHYLSLK